MQNALFAVCDVNTKKTTFVQFFYLINVFILFSRLQAKSSIGFFN